MQLKIDIPSKAAMILEQLNKHGFEAYIVGGCVRDAIMGRIPQDWDITTSAKPEQVKAIFRRTIDTGLEHGTVTVMVEKEGFEVTTYRIDGEYEDARHPKEVTFTASLKEDLSRRDFTINAMAYNPQTGLVDEFGGMEDLDAGVIRCVGDARIRFTEDALRILRAVRFSAQLNYVIEEQTLEAMTELSPNLSKISAERIHAELTKLLVSGHPDRMFLAQKTGITKVVLPEFDRMADTLQKNPHHQYPVGEHCIHSIEHIHTDAGWDSFDEKTKAVLSYTMLLHDIGKPSCKTTDEKGIDHFYKHQLVSADMARDICNRLKFDNDSKEKIVRLIQFHDLHPEETMAGVRKAAHRIGPELMELYFSVQRADLLAQSTYRREEKFSRLEQVKQLYDEIKRQQQCLSIKELDINGNDLIQAGIPKGPEIGKILSRLLELVLEDSEKNRKEELLILARQFQNDSTQ